MGADCELPLADRRCGLPATARCTDCGRDCCASHQAYRRDEDDGRVTGYYRDLCEPCLGARLAAWRALLARLGELLDALGAAGMPGSVKRVAFETERRWFRERTLLREREPAVPVGRLWWLCDGEEGARTRRLLATGITASGRWVLMNAAELRDAAGAEPAPGQEAAVVAALERRVREHHAPLAPAC
ncbi:hypothetical protein [Streptacidiphilus monticola]|uniref:Uncharacterized protein n=1 Tax=Streptacidiphilus monticola TaxID=2161674 RepID=A0ABW1FWE1_9ACTN